MDGRVDGVKLDVIDAKAKDAGAHIAEARHLEAGDERRAVGLVALDQTDRAMAQHGVRLRELGDPQSGRVLAHLAGARAHEEDFFSHVCVPARVVVLRGQLFQRLPLRLSQL